MEPGEGHTSPLAQSNSSTRLAPLPKIDTILAPVEVTRVLSVSSSVRWLPATSSTCCTCASCSELGWCDNTT